MKNSAARRCVALVACMILFFPSVSTAEVATTVATAQTAIGVLGTLASWLSSEESSLEQIERNQLLLIQSDIEGLLGTLQDPENFQTPESARLDYERVELSLNQSVARAYRFSEEFLFSDYPTNPILVAFAGSKLPRARTALLLTATFQQLSAVKYRLLVDVGRGESAAKFAEQYARDIGKLRRGVKKALGFMMDYHHPDIVRGGTYRAFCEDPAIRSDATAMVEQLSAQYGQLTEKDRLLYADMYCFTIVQTMTSTPAGYEGKIEFHAGNLLTLRILEMTSLGEYDDERFYRRYLGVLEAQEEALVMESFYDSIFLVRLSQEEGEASP